MLRPMMCMLVGILDNTETHQIKVFGFKDKFYGRIEIRSEFVDSNSSIGFQDILL